MKKKRRQKKTAQHRQFPRWAWWMGGIGISVVYVWLFYTFFVGPTGFRWRALYGDARYPDGFEIHGIDISHYQEEIEWDKLRHARIEGCPLRFIIIKSTRSSTNISTKPANTVSFAEPTIFGATSRRPATRRTIS